MAVLQPEEYDISYFDGKKGTYSHNAGYTEYKRWQAFNVGTLGKEIGTTGEYFKDIAKLYDFYGLVNNKKILDIGCAYGFIVEDLRQIGANAYGLDISQYAYDQANSEVQPYLTVADARTYLSNYANNEFNVIFSRWFLECISDEDLPSLINEMNRISKLQIHIVNNKLRKDFYNSKTSEDWLTYDFNKGILILTEPKLNIPHKK